MNTAVDEALGGAITGESPTREDGEVKVGEVTLCAARRSIGSPTHTREELVEMMAKSMKNHRGNPVSTQEEAATELANAALTCLIEAKVLEVK